MLKAMAKKAKSIVTLSLPKCRKRRYAILNFICPKTAFLMVKFLELSQVKALDYRIDYAHRIFFSDILVGIDCQKQSFVIVRFCM